MAIVLALASAVVYGIADYCGGRATRTATAFAVTLLGQAVSLGLLLLIMPVLGHPAPPVADWLWGAGGGAAGVLGLLCFYEALSSGAMTVVAPVTAVISAALPVATGLVLGERPGGLAIAGMVLACVAIALVSGAGAGGRRTHATPRVLALAALAGVGFALIFVFLDRTSDASGLWPLVSARLVSVPLILVIATATRSSVRVPRPIVPIALASGALDMSANVLYLLATRRGLLSVVAVISAMYPASTVCLAVGIDDERVERSQAVGLGLAAAALALVALGRA